MNKKKLIARFLLSLLLFTAVERFCHYQTDGFALHKIQSSLPYDPLREAAGGNDWDEIKVALEQPYSYLGKGAQSFAFLSQDKKYVLKFFRYDHLRAPFWSGKEKAQLKTQRLHRQFMSCRIAYDELKEETGLLYLHLNKTEDLFQKISLFDKLGIRHLIAIDDYEFILQKKADHVFPTLLRYVQGNEIGKAKKGIKDILELIAARSQKGIFDKDPDIRTNFGFLGEKAVQIDIGRFKKDAERKNVPMQKEELLRITALLREWLKGQEPSLADYLEQEVDLIASRKFETSKLDNLVPIP